MKTLLSTGFAGLLALPMLVHAAGQTPQHAHVHGVAKLDIAVEANTLTLQLEAPLDNFLGFERAPRTDAERQQADAAVAKLRAADKLFRIDPAAGCTLKSVALSSSALKLGQPDPAEEQAGHADLDGSFEFACKDAAKASYLDVGLFDFKPTQQLQVQVATPAGQFKRDLKRPALRISLVK